MTIYSHHNATGSCVYDMDTLEKLPMVISIDTYTGAVVCAYDPLRADANNDLAVFTINFRSIYPIFGGARYPCLFHCYGRINKETA